MLSLLLAYYRARIFGEYVLTYYTVGALRDEETNISTHMSF